MVAFAANLPIIPKRILTLRCVAFDQSEYSMRLLLCVVALTANTTAACAAPITFDRAIELAVTGAPSIAARTAAAEASRSTAVPAASLPDPRLEFGIAGFPVSGPNAGHPERDDFSAIRVGIEQDVPNLAKRRARSGRAVADIAASDAAVSSEVRTVKRGAALAWIDLYFVTAKLAALDTVYLSVKSLVATTPARFASGSVRPAQTVEPALLVAAIDDRRAELVAEAGKAKAALVRWTGDPAPSVLGNPPTLVVDEARLRGAVERLPEVAIADAATAQAKADVGLARAEKRPDWSWQVGYDRRDPRFGDMLSAGVKIGLPLFSRNRQDPVIAAREQDVRRARLDREATLRELQAGLAADLADHAMHHERAERARTLLLPLAERRATLERASYAGGTASLDDAFIATIAVAEARLELLNRQADVVRDAVRINLTYRSEDQ